LVPVLAYLTVVVLYLVEEVRYNAAEMERVRQLHQKASSLP
jgi:hypothetical protein